MDIRSLLDHTPTPPPFETAAVASSPHSMADGPDSPADKGKQAARLVNPGERAAEMSAGDRGAKHRLSRGSTPPRDGTKRTRLEDEQGEVKTRIDNLGILSGESFFLEVNALLDLSKRPETDTANSVNQSELAEAFLKHFEEKTKLFASTCPKSGAAGFDTPITTLCRFMPGFGNEAVKQCDAMVHRLIQAIPEYARPVPKRAFCIWEGGEISQEHLNNLARFMKLNPDYSLTLLSSKPKSIFNATEKRSDGHWLTNLDRFKIQPQEYSDNQIAESAINRENNGIFANYAAGSDIGRVHALVKKDEDGNSGGLYFDVDSKFHKPLPQLFAPFGVLILQTDKWFMNGIIAAPPGSEVLQEALDEMLKPYDERGKGTWSPDIWIGKRAGILAPKDKEGSEAYESKGKGRANPKKPQGETLEEKLAQDIAYFEKTEYTAWTGYLRKRQTSLRENPRQRLTAETTVSPLMDAMGNKFGDRYSMFSMTLNRFGEMLGEDKIFELPHDEKWSAPNTGNHQASII
jgi:hypothetical protein